MTTQIAANFSAATHDALALPTSAMDNLAAQLRPNGLCLLLMGTDGAPIWHDPAAASFFQNYLLPQLQDSNTAEVLLRDPLARAVADGAVMLNDVVPGVILAGFPHISRRRQVRSVVLLAAKSEDFRLGEDVLRVCSRLGMDSLYLEQLAGQLPAYRPEALQQQGRLALGCVRDQLRMGSLEEELESLSHQLANTYEELSLVYHLSGAMKVNRRATDFFKEACLEMMEVIGAQGVGIAIRPQIISGHEPVTYGRLVLAPTALRRVATQIWDSLDERKGAIVVNELHADPRFPALAAVARQLLAVPLQREHQIFGCLFAVDKHQGEFNSVDAKLLVAIANQLAVYMENARLFEDVHGLMMGLLHSLSSAVDAKDSYTCGHSERVAALARHIASHMGLADHEVERVYMAALLHDVGKIGVSEAVLQKAGKLTPEEFEQMKRHPRIGARILQDIPQVNDIVPGILYHHERYDGKGYPAGLVGEQIPLMGRIICLADGLDAMTSSRTYRVARPLEAALEEVQRCSGSQFDPALVEVVMAIGAEGIRKLLDEHQQRAQKLVGLQQSLRTLEVNHGPKV